MPADDCVVALAPDWGGRIWFATARGRVGAVDPRTGQAQVLALEEAVANPLAVDPDGVYVVTTDALYRLRAGRRRPVVAWRASYDRGTRTKPGQLDPGHRQRPGPAARRPGRPHRQRRAADARGGAAPLGRREGVRAGGVRRRRGRHRVRPGRGGRRRRGHRQPRVRRPAQHDAGARHRAGRRARRRPRRRLHAGVDRRRGRARAAPRRSPRPPACSTPPPSGAAGGAPPPGTSPRSTPAPGGPSSRCAPAWARRTTAGGPRPCWAGTARCTCRRCPASVRVRDRAPAQG